MPGLPREGRVYTVIRSLGRNQHTGYTERWSEVRPYLFEVIDGVSVLGADTIFHKFPSKAEAREYWQAVHGEESELRAFGPL